MRNVLLVGTARKGAKVPCPAAWYCEEGTTKATKKRCPASTYSKKNMEQVKSKDGCSKIDCPAGWYCGAGATESTKKPCPAGTYSKTETIRLKKITDCDYVPCPAGYWCTPGSVESTLVRCNGDITHAFGVEDKKSCNTGEQQNLLGITRRKGDSPVNAVALFKHSDHQVSGSDNGVGVKTGGHRVHFCLPSPPL